MARFGAGRAFRALGVFAMVLGIVAVVTVLNYFIFFRGQTFEQAAGLGRAVLARSPEFALFALVVTVFTMNRIRSVALIAIAALLAVIFIFWAPLLGMYWLYANGVFWSTERVLTKFISEDTALVIQIIVLYVLGLAGAFLIIKLTAAAGKALARRPADSV
jgi:hypothetical protein